MHLLIFAVAQASRKFVPLPAHGPHKARAPQSTRHARTCVYVSVVCGRHGWMLTMFLRRDGEVSQSVAEVTAVVRPMLEP